jgi:hypothetical protein
MNIGKALAVSAVAGMILGTVACGGGSSSTPGASDPAASGSEKSSCSGKGAAPAATGTTADPAATGTGTAAPAAPQQ